MRKGIHPKYEETNVECVCGASYKTQSTIKISKIDICANCHPFYTGKQKVLDTEGRIEKFNKKFGTAHAEKVKQAKNKANKK